MHLGGGVSDQKRTVGRVPQLLVHLLPKTAKTDSASLRTSCMSSHGVCVCVLPGNVSPVPLGVLQNHAVVETGGRSRSRRLHRFRR